MPESTVIDDLIAVRTLLILRGRAVNYFVDDEGRVCLRQAIFTVSRGSVDVGAVFEDPAGKSYDEDYDMDNDPHRQFIESRAAEVAMSEALKQHLPRQMFEDDWVFEKSTGTFISLFNDKYAESDQDVFDLIDKALAELGGLA